ncbi:MAG: DNA polymerase I [Candidatus Magasanikbacteria bacterium]|nr:DNA polymerase I [Candidatus Magasanikbacteria bacterium]
MEKEQKRLIIVDGNAVIHRAYHAIPPLTTKDGHMVNAVYGFATMLLKVLADFKPDYLAVTFDMAGGTFRDELFKEYKAKRVKADQELYDQIPLIHDLVAAFGIQIFEQTGFEADDIIGTIVALVKDDKNLETIIVSGDMDLFQLVEENVKVCTFKKGLSEFGLMDPAAVLEKYGFGPKQVVDYKGLRGDTSDNIPGVPGIGEVTATSLIKKFGSLDNLYEEIKKGNPGLSPSVYAKLVAGEESARMSYEVATIHCEMKDLNFDLEKIAVKPLDKTKLLPLLQKFEFVALAKRLGGPDSVVESEKKSKKVGQEIVETILPGKSAELITRFHKVGYWVAKEVVTGSVVPNGEFVGFVVNADKPVFVEWAILNAADKKAWRDLCSDEHVELRGHDVKQLIKCFASADILVRNRLFDLMIASYVTNSSTRAHDVASIALRELAEEAPVSGQETLFGPELQSRAYCLSVVERTYPDYCKALKKNNDEELFYSLEMKLIPVLAEMEMNGLEIDSEYLQDLAKIAATQVDSITKQIWKEAGEEFNVSSSVQLRDILYEKMGLKVPGIKKGKTGYSTAAAELEKMRGSHPIIELIEDYRELTKLQNTYLDVLPTMVNKKTGRLHGSFNQAVAATGRLSSTDPNLQNIPARTEFGKKIREAFIAPKGKTLIVADYSQFELRIVASMAEDAKLIEIFKKGEDVHKATAAVIHNIPLEEVTKELRFSAKEINFGVLYGMGAYGLASRTGISQFEAKDFITKYFEQFAGVKKYIDETIEFAKANGYVETLLGRRRYIPEIQSANHQLRAAGERMAVNMPVQGTQADLIKKAMIDVSDYLRKNFKPNEVKMILQVHDELVFEVDSKLVDTLAPKIKSLMSEVTKLKVPIEVNVGTGDNWGEAK